MLYYSETSAEGTFCCVVAVCSIVLSRCLNLRRAFVGATVFLVVEPHIVDSVFLVTAIAGIKWLINGEI